jgi:hypothetical protein
MNGQSVRAFTVAFDRLLQGADCRSRLRREERRPCFKTASCDHAGDTVAFVLDDVAMRRGVLLRRSLPGQLHPALCRGRVGTRVSHAVREAAVQRALVTNLVVAYVLLVVVGGLELRRVADVAMAATGFGLGSLFIARSLTRMQRERDSAMRPGSPPSTA